MYPRKRVLQAFLCTAALLVTLIPFCAMLESGKAFNHVDDMQRQISDMHIRHAERTKRAPGADVEPIIAIEEAWAIEDTREEAMDLLVSEMHHGSDELGFDRESGTFYCSIAPGLEQWPELRLTARGEAGVRIAWIDDYAYDSCADAVREGYRYEMIAYTETEYSYLGVVFTGLPVVTLHVSDEKQLGEEYIAGRASVAGAGYDAIDSAALIHLRGGRFDKGIDKPSYRVEFHRLSDKGKDKKNDMKVLGIESDSDWLLISNAGDVSCMRNWLGFDMWNQWNAGDHAFAMLDSRMVEVFMQDEYMGLYQLLPRIDEDDELDDAGGSPHTDVVARLIGMRFETGRPVSQMSLPIDGCLELRQYPKWMGKEEAFSRFENYVRLNLPKEHEDYLDDGEFAKLALQSVDVYDLMSYYLYMNVCSLPYDNVKNNVYIWALEGENGYTYSLSPWDMDSGFSPLFKDESDSINMWMTLPVRMLELDVGGCRSILADIYREKRNELLKDDAVYQWIQAVEDEINASGAYLRETEKWRGGAQTLNLEEISAHTISQLYLIERYIEEIWTPKQ